jgi:hypothetical protein
MHHLQHQCPPTNRASLGEQLPYQLLCHLQAKQWRRQAGNRCKGTSVANCDEPKSISMLHQQTPCLMMHTCGSRFPTYTVASWFLSAACWPIKLAPTPAVMRPPATLILDYCNRVLR